MVHKATRRGIVMDTGMLSTSPPHQAIYLPAQLQIGLQVKVVILQASEGRRRKNNSHQFISGKNLPSPTTVVGAKAIRGTSQAWMCRIPQMDRLITESGQELGRANVQAIVWLG